MIKNLILFFILLSIILFIFSCSFDLHLVLNNKELKLASIGDFWFALSRNNLQITEAIVSRYLDPCSVFLFLSCAPFIWHPLISTLLLFPATPSFLILILIFYAFKKYTPKKKRTFVRY